MPINKIYCFTRKFIVLLSYPLNPLTHIPSIHFLIPSIHSPYPPNSLPHILQFTHSYPLNSLPHPLNSPSHNPQFTPSYPLNSEYFKNSSIFFHSLHKKKQSICNTYRLLLKKSLISDAYQLIFF